MSCLDSHKSSLNTALKTYNSIFYVSGPKRLIFEAQFNLRTAESGLLNFQPFLTSPSAHNRVHFLTLFALGVTM